jgi:glycosylphosphatidylinositol deacylase
MGGLIGRHVLSMPDFDVSRVGALITFATPHSSPVLPYDASVLNFYAQTNKRAIAAHITVVSVGGGSSDMLVPSHTTHVDGAVVANAPDIEYVWASTDHLCIVWCNQLTTCVMTSSRAHTTMSLQ